MDFWKNLPDSQRRQIVLAVAVVAGAAVMYMLCRERPQMLGLREGFSEETGIYVGTSDALLRRTGGARWEGRYPIVPYDPNSQGQFAGSGIYSFRSLRFEILTIVHGQMCVRVLPYSGRADNWWGEDLWIDARRFTGPWPDDVSRNMTRWRHHYLYRPNLPGGGGKQGSGLTPAPSYGAPKSWCTVS